MPNWCSTMICIQHEDVNKLKQLESRIDEWCENSSFESDFGKYWLGNVVIGSKIGTVDEGKAIDLNCRGQIEWIETSKTGNTLRIDTLTAWVPMLKMWKRLVDEYLPDAEIIYACEETGEGIFLTNDPVLVDTYAFESSEEEEKYEEMSINDCIECFER